MSTPAAHEEGKSAGDAAALAGGAVGPGRIEPLPLDLTSPQFTLRAVLTGMVLGAVVSACNVYAGLKIGLSLPIPMVAIVLGLSFWRSLGWLSRGGVRQFGVLENTINLTACSAAGSVASAGLVAAIPALALIQPNWRMAWPTMSLWVFAVCLVGITAGVALRHHMLVRDPLPFPFGIANAQLLRELHARGSDALARVLMLFSFAGIASAIKLVTELVKPIARHLPLALGFSIQGISAKALTLAIDVKLLMVAVGALIGLRAAASLLFGAIVAYGVLAPSLIRSGHLRLTARAPLQSLPDGADWPAALRDRMNYQPGQQRLEWKGVMTAARRDALLALSNESGYQEAIRQLHIRSQLEVSTKAVGQGDQVQWLLCPGVTLMVVSSLVSLLMSWRSLAAAVSSVGRRARAPEAQTTTRTGSGDVPALWLIGGLLFGLVLAVGLQVSVFAIVWWAALLGVVLSFFFAAVAARVSGETGMTPAGPMGKLTQLVFGFLLPASPAANLMTANVTGGAASQCAELLHDLKCGWLVGASAKWQVLAQTLGALAGAMVGSATYLLLVPDPSALLLTSDWPAPAVATWKAVAELFQRGARAMPPGADYAMGIAAAVGILLPVLEKLLPVRGRRLVPSAASLGLAFVLPGFFVISIFVGAVLSVGLRRWLPRWSGRFLLVGAAGIVAGESLTDVVQRLVLLVKVHP